MSTETVQTTAPESGRPRRFTSLFIAAFLLVQCLIPLRFYLRDRPDDPRFCWRMFTGQDTHAVSLFETIRTPQGERERPVQLQGLLPEQWLRIVQRRNLQDIIDGILRWRGSNSDVVRTRMVSVRVLPDGSREPSYERIYDVNTNRISARRSSP